MFNLEDYENILNYFDGKEDIPDSLKKTINKLQITYEEINFRKETAEKLKEFQERLAKIDEE